MVHLFWPKLSKMTASCWSLILLKAYWLWGWIDSVEFFCLWICWFGCLGSDIFWFMIVYLVGFCWMQIAEMWVLIFHSVGLWFSDQLLLLVWICFACIEWFGLQWEWIWISAWLYQRPRLFRVSKYQNRINFFELHLHLSSCHLDFGVSISSVGFKTKPTVCKPVAN